MGHLRRLQGQPARRLRLRPRRPLLLVPRHATRTGLREAEHHRALRRAHLEIPVAQVQLQRQQQDVRHPGLARQQLPRPDRELRRRREGERRDRQGHGLRPPRPPVVHGQHQRRRQQQLRLRRLEGRRVDRDLRRDGRHLRHRHQRAGRAYYTNPLRQEHLRRASSSATSRRRSDASAHPPEPAYARTP